MILLNWSEEYSVGIQSIDKQHQKLIELLNAFYESIKNKEGKEKMLTVIRGLKDYTVHHFADEEKLMQIHNFPNFENHKKDHDAFVKAVLDFEDRFKSGKMLLTIEITNFIRDWITKHIMEIDKQYTVFLNQKGVK